MDWIHFIGIVLIFFALYICFAWIEAGEDTVGTYIFASTLWGTKFALFFSLLIISLGLSFWHIQRKFCLWQLFLLVVLLFCQLNWTLEIRTVLLFSSTDGVNLHFGIGFWLAWICLVILWFRQLYFILKTSSC